MPLDLGLTQRIDHPEMLDEGEMSMAERHRSLDDMRRMNGVLFGVQATLGPLLPWLREAPKPVTVLDLGTGSGQLSQALARWAQREGIALRLLAADLSSAHLGYANTLNGRLGTPNIHLAAADAFRLPLADQSVDIVISSLLLHHFAPDALAALLAECRRVARHGLVMSDLERSPLPYMLYRALVEPLLVRSPVTVYDGRVSFHRAYRREELQAIAKRVLPSPHVRLHLPSLRLQLTDFWSMEHGVW